MSGPVAFLIAAAVRHRGVIAAVSSGSGVSIAAELLIAFAIGFPCAALLSVLLALVIPGRDLAP